MKRRDFERSYFRNEIKQIKSRDCGHEGNREMHTGRVRMAAKERVTGKEDGQEEGMRRSATAAAFERADLRITVEHLRSVRRGAYRAVRSAPAAWRAICTPVCHSLLLLTSITLPL